MRSVISHINNAIELRREIAVEWLQQLIRFPSTQGNEREVQGYVVNLFEDIGFNAERRPISEELRSDPEYSHSDTEAPYEGRYNVVARWRGAGNGRSLIVQTHSDVVPADDWEDAFTPRYDGEYVYGRGAVDCKGQIVAMLLAVAALKDMGVELAGDLELQVVIEEEVGGNGALALIRQGCTADGVIVMESTSFNVYCANRGALWFRIRTIGKSIHMGRRNKGVNAIEKMVEVIHRLLAYERRLIVESQGHPLFKHYEHPVQLCLGIIRGGTWPSTVAGECTLEGGIGFLPNKSIEQIKCELLNTIAATDDEWLKNHFELTFPKLHNDAYEISPDHPLPVTVCESVRDIGLPCMVTGWNVSCDARLYAKLANIPTVVYGAGDVHEAHSVGEKMRLQDMLDAAKGLALSILRWCGVN